MPEEINKPPLKIAEIKVRQLEWNAIDLKQILEIETLSFNGHDAYTLEDFKRWFERNPDLCLAAESEGRIAGDVISGIRDNKAELSTLAIHPDYRRRGVGTALLEETAQRIRAYGIDAIDLEVRKTNRVGVRFWTKMGFSPIGEQLGFYEDGETALQMRKYL